MRVFKDLMWFFAQEKKAYITGVLLLMIVALLELVPPKVIGMIIDHVKNGTLTKVLLRKWIILFCRCGCTLHIALPLAHFDFRFCREAVTTTSQ
jgi:ATP-binding cassette subfamily B protein